jgi:cytochrome c
MRGNKFAGALLIASLLMAGGSVLLTGQTHASKNGDDLFERRCSGCHALDRDKEGPRLGGVYGRKAGSVDSFSYSDALKNSNITWNEEFLQKWLTDSEQLVPNNNMTFRVENADERLAIIAYLKQNSGKQH